jgi:hypothetical protein
MLVLTVPYYVILSVPYTVAPSVIDMKNGSVGDLIQLEKAIFDALLTLHGGFLSSHIFMMLAREFVKPADEQDFSFASFIREIDPMRTCGELLQTYAFLDGAWKKDPMGGQELLFDSMVRSAIEIIDAIKSVHLTEGESGLSNSCE